MLQQREAGNISPFFGYEPYPAYGPDWEAKRLRELATKTDGDKGKLIAMLPEAARGRTDSFDDGRFERWQDAIFDDSRWQRLLTTSGWDSPGFTHAQRH